MRTLTLFIASVTAFLFTSAKESSCLAEWEPVFLVKPGNGQKAYEAWTRYTSSCECSTVDGCLPSGVRLAGQSLKGKHLTSPLIQKWSDLLVQEVKVELYTNGERVAFFVFNGNGSTNLNWFAQDRLIDSSYDDLYSDGIFNKFSIEGDGRTVRRRFYINQNYGGCPNDYGWVFVSDGVPAVCSFDKHSSYPQILYAKNHHKARWAREFGVADSMEVYIRRQVK